MRMIRQGMVLLGSSILVLAISGPARAADCSAQAEMVDATCYATVQEAANAAISLNRPLLLPRGSYQGPLTIDYTAQAGTGFELISRGATIYGGLTIECSGSCFYFHQEGTLFIDGQVPGYLVTVGKIDFSDAQNSIKIDHMIVNNGGSGGAVQLNYVLNADLFIVANTAGQAAGLDVRQLQFSILKGAMSSGQGYSMVIEDGYVISNSFQSLDQEASPACLAMTSPHANGNLWLSVYQDCPALGVLYRSALTGNVGVGGVTGGAVQQGYILE
jgi:hypothetical protein